MTQFFSSMLSLLAVVTIIQDLSLLTQGDTLPPAVYLANALRFVSYVSSGFVSIEKYELSFRGFICIMLDMMTLTHLNVNSLLDERLMMMNALKYQYHIYHKLHLCSSCCAIKLMLVTVLWNIRALQSKQSLLQFKFAFVLLS